MYNPGTSLDGYTNHNWSFLAQDTTGSLDMFYSSTAGGAQAYNRSVGDSIVVQGTYTPFNGIPEIGNGAAQAISVTFGTAGNPFYTPAPLVTTIPVINVGTNGRGLNASGLAGAYLQLNNVTISNPTTNGVSTAGYWGFHANVTAMIGDGSNSMTMFLWASSYSTCAAIQAAGGLIPTGPVDITGFVDDFSGSTGTTAEFVPISITVVPEPAAIGLCGLGSLLAWVLYRLRKKA
jgi:hypothetical protein